MWQAGTAPTKPRPRLPELDSYLPIVYVQEVVNQPRDRWREPNEEAAVRRGAKSEVGGVFLVGGPLWITG